MGMLRIVALLLPVLVAVLFAPYAIAHQQDDVTQHLALRSVLHRDHDVFASNETGLYRAELRDKIWKKLPVLEAMPKGGRFAHSTGNSKFIFYYATFGATEKTKEISGLYLSEDDGQTWKPLTFGTGYKTVFQHTDGNLYVATDYGKYRGPVTVLMSKDLGKNWRNITGNGFSGVYSIFPDPEHPNLVCLEGILIRHYILQAKDENYQWNYRMPGEWRREHPRTEKEFFSRDFIVYYDGVTLSHLYATLDNYFAYEFGNRVMLHGLDIVPQERAYEFEKSEAKRVQISVPFLGRPAIENKQQLWKLSLPPTTVEFVDQETGQGFWGLNIVDPTGKQISIRPSLGVSIFNSKDEKSTKQHLRSTIATQKHEITNIKPYVRLIDLGQLYDFAIPGIYKVQLIYDNSRFVERGKDRMDASFSGQVFTVTINEDSNALQRVWKLFQHWLSG